MSNKLQNFVDDFVDDAGNYIQDRLSWKEYLLKKYWWLWLIILIIVIAGTIVLPSVVL